MKSSFERARLHVIAISRGALLSFALLVLAQTASAQGWQELPNTKLQTVCPPDGFGGMNYAFSFSCKNVINAWGGGIADTARNRLIIWGGGHSDYYGNEIYSLNLGNSPATLTRLTDPSPITDPLVCPTTLADGKPNSRHTYSNVAYMSHVDRMFVFNGGLACANGQNLKDTWTLNLASLQWQRMDPANGAPPGGSGPPNAIAAYDPISHLVYLQWGSGLWQYQYDTNTYTRLSLSSPVSYAATGVIDPQRRLFIFMGAGYQSTAPHVYAIDLAPGSSYIPQDWTSQVSGCDPLASALFPGLVYDSSLDRIVGWPNAGGTAYAFNPSTKTCTAYPFANGPQNQLPVGTGTFGRFSYFPALGRYAVVSNSDLNAFTLTLDGTAPPADTTPPSVSLTAPGNGATVAGTITASATASDNASVSSVEFLLDAVSLANVAISPYTINWDSKGTTNGSHTLKAVARDAAGNSATATITVTVNNTSGGSGSTTGATGMGGSTLTCLDRDGDGLGVGAGCSGPDADDLDATVRTGADGIAKYGTMNGLLAHFGYQPVKVWYVSLTGNDLTGAVNNVDRPYQTYHAISSLVRPGDAVIFRQGTYTFQVGAPNGAAGSPIIYMSYPGELATFTGSSAGILIVDRSYLTVDGIRFQNYSCMSGGTWDANTASTFHDNTFRHIEGSGCTWGFSAFNGLINILIEDSSFHDNPREHGIYIGSRNLASANVTVRRTLLYNNNYNGFQFNGRVTNLVVEQNIVYGNLLSAFSLLEGVSNSFVRSNLAFNNGRTGVIFYNYNGNCWDITTRQTECPHDQRDNVIENNTIFNSGKDREGTPAEGQGAIQVANGVTGLSPSGVLVGTPKFGDLGHNTFRNNILVSWGGNNHYPPIIFNDADKDYLSTSTFVNNRSYQDDGLGGLGVIGFGPSGSWGFAPYTCATAASVTTISGCSVGDPKFVSASTSFWNSSALFDLRLQQSSPAVGAGVAGGGLYDLVGNAFATPRSLGAYEASTNVPPPPPPSCDLNHDGVVNSTDVQAAVTQALGGAACSTADLQPDGRCNVIDVQRIVIATLGAACVTGQ